MSERLMLEVRGVGKSFAEGDHRLVVLADLDLQVAAGERIAILGRSGSGKSTLLHVLGGLTDPDAGEVIVNGQALNVLDAAGRARLRNAEMGFVYQFHHLLPEFSAVENVALPLLLGKTGVAEAHARAEALLESVGLADRLNHRPGQLSGGERQRVAIARALVAEPAVVLADEPTGNLDRQSAEQVFDVMLELAERVATAFVIVTHDENLAGQMQRCLLLEDGRLGPYPGATGTASPGFTTTEP